MPPRPITTVAVYDHNNHSRTSTSLAVRYNDRFISLLACYAFWAVVLLSPRADTVAVGGGAGVVVVACGVGREGPETETHDDEGKLVGC